MRVLLSIVGIVIALAIIFFVFNYYNLELVELDNGIGTYSAVRLELYDKYDSDNVNAYHSYGTPSNYIGDFDVVVYINEASLKIPSNGTNYPNLTEIVDWFVEKAEDLAPLGYVLDDKSQLITKIFVDGFKLPVETPSNIPMTPERFAELYPTGYDIVIPTARVYKYIQGVIPDETNYFTITDISARVYCGLNPDGSGTYIVSVVPYEYLYEYNLFQTLTVLEQDITAIKNSKPNIPNIKGNITESIFWESLLNLISYPIKYIKYISTSAELIITDVAGIILVNDFEVYHQF